MNHQPPDQGDNQTTQNLPGALKVTTTKQRKTTPAEELLDDIHPFFGQPHTAFPEPDEAINKLLAILRALMACQDDETCEFTISAGDVAWNLILAHDLAKDISNRVSNLQDNVLSSWSEAKRRVDACHVVKMKIERRRSEEQ